MPPLPAVTSTIKVQMEWQISSLTYAVSRFFVAYTGTAPTTTQLNTFAASVATAWNTNLAPQTSTTYNLVVVQCEDLSSSTGATGVWTGTHLGTLAGGNLPANVCMVVAYNISRRYRGGHPRGYWPAGDETKVNNDQTWTNAFLTAFTTAVTNFFTAVFAAGWTGAGVLTQVNVGYYHGFTVVTSPTTGRARNVPTLRVTPLVDTVTTYSSRSIFGSQRRRLRSTLS